MSFPQALKEFISNSHDANATQVALLFEDDFSALTIRDNGDGMTLEEFANVFASIARTGRKSAVSKGGNSKRKRIGRFGIGALAVVGTGIPGNEILSKYFFRYIQMETPCGGIL